MPKVPELPELYARVGANIRRCRIAAGMTQEALSLAAGIGRTSITNIEYGRQRLQLDTLALIARELGVDAAELMIPISADDFPVEVIVNGKAVKVTKDVADMIRASLKETTDES